ncbi:F-box protein Pof8 [Schizosaccharomyces pombe]
MFVPRQLNVRKIKAFTGKENNSIADGNNNKLKDEHYKHNEASKEPSHSISGGLMLNQQDRQLIEPLNPDFLSAIDSILEIYFHRERQKEKVHLAFLIQQDDFWKGIRPNPTQNNLKYALSYVTNALFHFDNSSHMVIRNENIVLPLDIPLYDRIIYVEPVPATLSNKSLLLAGKLRKYLKEFLPYVDAIGTPEGYAFVILYKKVDQSALSKLPVPPGWVLLTRKEWTNREEKYFENQLHLVKASSSDVSNSSNSFPENRYPKLTKVEKQMTKSVSKTSQTDKDEDNLDFTKNLLTRIKNLHPLTNKSTIHSLLSYVFSRQTQNIACEPMYIDYRKDETEAIIRWKTPLHAETCINAFRTQERKQNSHDDIRAHRKKGSSRPFLIAELITGEEEKNYWRMLKK